MRSSHTVDRVDTAFDDDRLVADAGLLLPATLAAHLGLRELVERHLDLGARPGAANVGDKLLTLVMSALAGGDSIDDTNALRAGGTERILGFTVKAASTLGTFLRGFRWGHVRQLDAVSRQVLARAWAAGAGPGCAPLTIDLDSTISFRPRWAARVAGRRSPASATRRSSSNAVSSRSRLCEDRINQVLLFVGRWVVFNAHLPSSDGHLIRRFRASQPRPIGGSGISNRPCRARRPRTLDRACGGRAGHARAGSHETSWPSISGRYRVPAEGCRAPR